MSIKIDGKKVQKVSFWLICQLFLLLYTCILFPVISRNIFLTDIDEVMEFVNQVEKCSYNVDIAVDDSVINAKSVLGMLSKGFRRMMRMDIHADHADELLEKIARFCI